ncbi:sugar transferase [Miltoncostaea marina]|uniref:sugar transferase n=1 Tax=Miltoncostaea marina TaxID=2843215 RepID=UPI001C3E6AAE|nr:sugar transferase [Miltoncostaea marina]
MSTHAAFQPNPHLAAPVAEGAPRQRVPRLAGACQALVAALVAANMVLWLADVSTTMALSIGAGLGILSAVVVAWTVPPAERGRPVLVRRYRLGHCVGAVLSTAMLLAIAGQAAIDELSALDALALAAAAVGAAWLVAMAIDRTFGRPRRVLVVGTGEVAQHLVGSLPGGRRGFEVIGTVDDQRLPPTGAVEAGAPQLGDVTELGDLVRDHSVDLVIFSFVGSSDRELQDAVGACRAAGAQVAVVSRLFEGLHGSLSLRRLEGLPVVVAGSHRSSRGNEIAQRATDIVLSAAMLVLTAPLWAALAVAIKIDSRGPVLYRAKRIGRDERPFAMLKFRKMHDGAAGPALTMDEDDRFTRMGRFLAHSKLDELPQLWNVLKGDMSFVGPRPEDARYVRAHHDAYRRVLAVRPGITGLSQIRYRREFEHLVGDDFEAFYLNTLLPTKLAIDQYYVDHQSWLLDMKCIIWTAVALLRGGELQLSELASHVAFRQPKAQPVRLHRAPVDEMSHAA